MDANPSKVMTCWEALPVLVRVAVWIFAIVVILQVLGFLWELIAEFFD